MRVNCVSHGRGSGKLKPDQTYVIAARDGARVAYWHGPWWESDPAGAAIYATRDAAEDALVDAEAAAEIDDIIPDSATVDIELAGGCAGEVRP